MGHDFNFCSQINLLLLQRELNPTLATLSLPSVPACPDQMTMKLIHPLYKLLNVPFPKETAYRGILPTIMCQPCMAK